MKNHWKRITFTAFVLIATYFVIHFTLLNESSNKLLFNIISLIGSGLTRYSPWQTLPKYQRNTIEKEWYVPNSTQLASKSL